jgi:hypothetical protein
MLLSRYRVLEFVLFNVLQKEWETHARAKQIE